MTSSEPRPPYLRADGDDLYLRVHVQPGAKTDAIGGCHGDALKIRLRARPVDGAANTALSALLCATLHLKRQQITLVQGESARDKVLRISAASTHVQTQLRKYAESAHSPALDREDR
ncbi:DUF167 domain-containing protein [Acidithiobacillus sp.]|uniref:DUF167 domain-containing protein n=1 Tax=Acidithiobacillus sp. TaxID=1872118 RepID=UPI003D00551B